MYIKKNDSLSSISFSPFVTSVPSAYIRVDSGYYTFIWPLCARSLITLTADVAFFVSNHDWAYIWFALQTFYGHYRDGVIISIFLFIGRFSV